jgi:hypothetical protein
MSAIIVGGTSGTGLEVDTTSKAARATLYDSAGNEIAAPASGSYVAQIDLRPGAITAGAAVALWAIRNLGSKVAYIRRILLQGSVNPTTAVASSWYYTLNRFSAATPTGGNSITVLKKRNSYGSTSVTDARQIASAATSGLTTTSVTFEAAFSVLAGPRNNAANAVLDLNFCTSALERFNTFELAVNEGLAILLPTNASIAGDFMTGHIEWDER